MNNKKKVLFVATSRKTMGGITSVLKRYEKMNIWNKYQCAWLETQNNKNISLKLWYIIRAYITMLFIVPKYDIIHFHTVPGRSIIVQMPIFIYSLFWRKKTIIHIHVGNQLIEYKNNKVFKYVIQRATKVIVLADVIKDIIQEHYNIKAEVLYNPIEEQEIRKQKIINKNIFFAAYLTLNKGYDTILKAFKEVLIKHSDWNLIFAGSGETDKAKELINNLEIGNNIELHNWLNKEQMEQIYKKTSIYCIASKQEGFPMSFLEAASYGIPIVTTPVGGLVDVIEHEKNCMIFNFDNETELANQINELIENKKLREIISQNLQKLIKEYFSIESINNKIDILYNNIYTNQQ